ncbi:MAG TPA: hypothetical protein VNX21_02200 [Candidatus Thermoplasmatota archaeon]|nr:hypothetical protein [Candidatus Thermoplasmatota archaeon]
MKQNAVPYPKTLRINDWEDATTTTACTAGVKTRVGEIVVPEQTCYVYGRGHPSGPVELMGDIYGDIETAASADISGTLIVEAQNANDRNPVPLGEYDLARLRLGSSDPRLRIKVPLSGAPVCIGPNSKIVFYIKTTTTATFDPAASELVLDCITSYE